MALQNTKNEWDSMLTRDEEHGYVTEIDIRRAPSLQRQIILPFHFALIPQLRILDLTRARTTELPQGLDHLVNLQELILNHCDRLTTLPEEIGTLTSLTKLDLTCCGNLRELPPSIVRLSSLKHWDISRCEHLSNLPADIGALTALEFLSLRYCTRLQMLPPSITSLRNLRELLVAGCDRIISLPDQLGDLANLQELTLGRNADDGTTTMRVPATIGKLQNLRKLELFDADNAALPAEIWTLKNLQVLNLSYLDELLRLPRPVAGCQLASLKELDLTGLQKVSSLPKEIEELAQLEKLKLRDALFVSHIAIDFGRLVNLKELELGREIPRQRDEDDDMEILEQPRSFYETMALQIGQLQHLESLMLVASEPLWEAMMEKGSLVHMKRLHLAYFAGSTHLPWSKMMCLESLLLEECDDLLSLPSEIGQQQELAKLDIICNALRGLPEELTQLSKLEHFHLHSQSLSALQDDELLRVLTNIPKSVTKLSLDLQVESSFMDKFVAFDLPPHLRMLTLLDEGMREYIFSEEALRNLLRNNPYLCKLGMQSPGNKNVDFLLDMNYFRSLLIDKDDSMKIAMWPMIMNEVNKQLAKDKARRATVMYEMFRRSLHYNILSSRVGMECFDDDSMECDDVSTMQLDDNEL